MAFRITLRAAIYQHFSRVQIFEGKKKLMQEFGDLCLMRAAEAGGN
jgi:hypothetical protein